MALLLSCVTHLFIRCATEIDESRQFWISTKLYGISPPFAFDALKYSCLGSHSTQNDLGSVELTISCVCCITVEDSLTPPTVTQVAR